MHRLPFCSDRRSLFSFVFACLAVVSLPVLPARAQETVRHCMEGRKQYVEPVLKLVLSYSGRHYTIEDTGELCTQPRQIEGVLSGRLSFMWAGTTRELEERLHPIRYPLFKGLLGHRIFIIRKGDQHLFDQVDTLDDLRRIKLGQGRRWSDTEILEAAGMRVVKTNAYKNLFPMLEGGRFDAFPRGMSEPWNEIVTWSDLNLTVEQHIALIYPMPAYLFVSRDNTSLIRDLERGFEQAIRDGSFDRLFFADPEVRNALNQSDLKHRRVLRIENPFLSPQTPLDRKELWLDMTSQSDSRQLTERQ